MAFLAVALGGMTDRVLLAEPQGLKVVSGTATATKTGPQLTVNAANNAVLQWQSFNIAAGERTTFVQPSVSSIVWNKIIDTQPSKIFGSINANGIVVLMNQNGFYFGPNSMVQAAGGLVVTTAPNLSMDGGGGNWQFNGTPPLASIVNYGSMEVGSGHSLYLVAEKVENHGTLAAPEGNLGLFAGKEVLLSQSPDGRGLSSKVTLPAGSVDNHGKLIADGGSIALHAQVINNTGLLQANSVREHNGVIELIASDSVKLGATSQLSANGSATGTSAGGQITVKSDHTFSDETGSQISIRGGAQGGAGGEAEISAPSMSAIHTRVDGSATAGFAGGRLRIDPTDILLANFGDGDASSGTVDHTASPELLELNVNSAFVGLSQITLQATRDILLNENTIWDVSSSTGVSTPGSVLTLEAGRNIIFNRGSQITAGSGWSVQLAAGADFTAPLHVRSGTGGIYLNGGPADSDGLRPDGNGSLQTTDGNLTLVAGHEIITGAGFIRTTAGGSISVSTLTGDIDAGHFGLANRPDGFQGYAFTSRGYQVSLDRLGGISTAAGGNVTVNAGRDFLSFLPTSGAYGNGNVSLTAGRSIFGRFMVRNGTGRLDAGADIGTLGSPASFSLVSGLWDLHAGQDILLNEVLNPNGAFNSNRMISGARIRFQFDYADDAAVKLTAGNSVQLLGSNPARTANNGDRQPIYPPSLEINAGAGGVVLANDVLLYPSAKGSLKINTTGGGSLQSAPDVYAQLIMSDSGDPNYTSFATAHAATPLHLDSPLDSIRISVSGDIRNLFIRTPMVATIEAAGDGYNFAFEGQNLHATDVTSITLGKDFKTRFDRTFVTVSGTPDLSIFSPDVAESPEVGSRLTYNAQTHQLSYQGKMTEAERDILLHPRVKTFDITGAVLYDDQGVPIYKPAVLTADAAAINALYAATQDVPPSSSPIYGGVQMGGPGSLKITARNLDLGASRGIRSVGTARNSALNSISAQGAKIALQLNGNLDLLASQIASFAGAGIDIHAGGRVNVGSQEQFTSDDAPKGIYSAAGGNVSVKAVGDVNVSGSRIATFDGGNLAVASESGDVNAGVGGLGYIILSRTVIDPATGQQTTRNSLIPGSGIMATTLRDSQATVGDISVAAGKDIQANRGGILQFAFNNKGAQTAKIDLKAGRNIEASNSGIIGGNVSLDAKGNIDGLVVARNNISINSQQSVNVTALAGGGVAISASGNVSGSVVGGSSVSVSGSEVSAAMVSTSVSASGDTSGAKAGLPQNTATRTESKVADDADKTAGASKSKDEDPEEKKRKTLPRLARSVGRVTVILPNK